MRDGYGNSKVKWKKDMQAESLQEGGRQRVVRRNGKSEDLEGEKE